MHVCGSACVCSRRDDASVRLPLLALGSTFGSTQGRELLERAFPQIGIDIEGDGKIDFYKPRPPFIYYVKNLLPSLAITIVLQIVSGAIFVTIDPALDFGSAMYHCIVYP